MKFLPLDKNERIGKVRHMHRKEISYDRETRDFAMYLDGELIGWARTYQEAEITLNQVVGELSSGRYVYEAA